MTIVLESLSLHAANGVADLMEGCNHCVQALLASTKLAAVPSAMLSMALIARLGSAQSAWSASSGAALDVRWARVHASLAPAGSPSIVADHLANTLQVGCTCFLLLSILQTDVSGTMTRAHPCRDHVSSWPHVMSHDISNELM